MPGRHWRRRSTAAAIHFSGPAKPSNWRRKYSRTPTPLGSMKAKKPATYARPTLAQEKHGGGDPFLGTGEAQQLAQEVFADANTAGKHEGQKAGHVCQADTGG